MTDTEKLLRYAIDYLSKYNSSKKNLENILKKRIMRMKIEKKYKYNLYNSIPLILEKLEKNNFINDIDYTNSKIRFFVSVGKSRIYIKNYLLQKGIDSIVIKKSLEENDEKNSDWEIDSAKIFARKKNLKNNIHNNEKNLAKMARAGFNYQISKKILEEI